MRQAQRVLHLEFWLMFTTTFLAVFIYLTFATMAIHAKTQEELRYYKSHYTLNTTEAR
jgi:hypothetical protein